MNKLATAVLTFTSLVVSMTGCSGSAGPAIDPMTGAAPNGSEPDAGPVPVDGVCPAPKVCTGVCDGVPGQEVTCSGTCIGTCGSPSTCGFTCPGAGEGPDANAAPPATPAAFVVTKLSANSTHPEACKTLGNSFGLGTTTGGNPQPVADGDLAGDRAAQVHCSVTPAGGALFDLDLVASSAAGTVRLTTAVGYPIDPSQGGDHFSLALTSQQQMWNTPDCTISYTYGGKPILASPRVAAGRVWAHASCPMTVHAGATISVNGMVEPEVCDVEIDFQFQNCQ